MNEQLDIRDLELNALLEITQAINNNLPENDLYRIYRFTLLGDLNIKRLAMFVKDEDWCCKVHFGTSDSWEGVGLPKKYRMIFDQEEPDLGAPFDQFQLVFPVSHKQKLLAVVFIGGLEKVDEVPTTFLMALTNILIVAIENKKLARRQLEQEAYRRELEIAKKVQNFLFPKSLPKTSRLKIDAVYLPHQNVGGDYYDYIPLTDDKFLICIADVSGKGVPAALLMSNFQASLRTLIRKTHNLDEIIHELNHATYVSSNGENFITFFMGMYDYSDHTFSYANCGHNPSIIFNDGEITVLEEGTTVLGMFDPLPFLSSSKIEGISDFLFFGYTDGLTETFSPDNEQFGLDRLISLLDKNKTKSLTKLHEVIFTELDDFRKDNEFKDDITMISCQVSS